LFPAVWLGALTVCLALSTAPAAIDRHALVTRHNYEWNAPDSTVPLGNGEFCFTADGSGLQTFAGNTMAHWAWHSFPLPHGWTPYQVPATGTFQQGRNQGPDRFPPGTDELRRWMFDNPHIMNLARLRLCGGDGLALRKEDLSGLARSVDLWAGKQTSTYRMAGEVVRVETWVDASLDAVGVRIESPLVARKALQVALEFPYPSLGNGPWVGDFSRVAGHETELEFDPEQRALTERLSAEGQPGTYQGGVVPDLHRQAFRRSADDTTYHARLTWPSGPVGADGIEWVSTAAIFVRPAGPHRFLLAAPGKQRLEFLLAFSPRPITQPAPGVGDSASATARHRAAFWGAGGAIDLSGSKDPRWRELERRIVLSQYLMAAQSAGSFPSSEAGLMGIDPWRGQFHMEMVWWHLAHYALWDRWPMAEQALGCYQRFAPGAQKLAAQLGYRGLKWPKSVGPEGRSAPWEGNQVLLWKEPHPIFFAELEYRLRPGRATLDKWAEVVFGTAEHMADYPVRDEGTGVYSLSPAMPPSEQGVTRDTVFDLAYWRWGLDQAQVWRQRMGLPREPHWDEVRSRLAPLPVVDGVFVHSADWHDTFTRRAFEHPDPVGVLGMLPPIPGVDPEIAHRTTLKVWQTWDWDRCWGWDFPWLAMAAARQGEPRIAVDALLKESGRNRWDERGVNTGGPCPYLPGNGGLLYAVAMMAAGWDHGPDRTAPGFPDDGSWTVKWEGLKRAP